MSLTYRCLLGFLFFASHLVARFPHPSDDVWVSNRMTPEDVRQHGYHAAKDFSLAVAKVLTLSRNEDTFQEALIIWEKSSATLLTDVCILREGSKSTYASQLAADEVLDAIHVIFLGAFIDTDLLQSLSTCAWNCLDESSALEFENRFSEFYFQLLSQLNPPSNPPTHIRMDAFRPNGAWNLKPCTLVINT